MKFFSLFSIILSIGIASKSCSDKMETKDFKVTPHFDTKINASLGDTIVNLIKYSDTVNTFTISPTEGIDTINSNNNFQNYRIKEKVENLDTLEVLELKKIIGQDSTYNFNKESMSMCFFTPEIGFQFIKETQKVNLLYSSHCHELRFYSGEAEIILECNSNNFKITSFIKNMIHLRSKVN